MIHKSTIENYPGTMHELAEEIGDLKYDALAEFLQLLSSKIEKDGDKDKSRNRTKLAASLYLCSAKLNEAKIAIDRAWEISEPFMKS